MQNKVKGGEACELSSVHDDDGVEYYVHDDDYDHDDDVKQNEVKVGAAFELSSDQRLKIIAIKLMMTILPLITMMMMMMMMMMISS